MENLPLTTVKLKLYGQHIESIDSTMKPFSTVTMKDTLRSLEDNIWDKIVQRAKGSCTALTNDHWTSHRKDSYTGMTTHWIEDNFQLQNRFIGCWLHEGESESQNVQG